MKVAIDIVKNNLLPKLENDTNFNNNKINASFWENFTLALLDFETDAKPIYAAVYGLELENAEKIISKLPLIYADFIKELAENYVIGNDDAATIHLLQTKNATFETEVNYFKNLEKAIKNVERKRLKSELPVSYEKLTFELPEEAIEMAIKKKGREALKEKMNVWDEELDEVDAVLSETNYSNQSNLSVFTEKNVFENKAFTRASKVISLSWIKYAAAACILITAGVFYFKSSESKTEPGSNDVVKTIDIENDSVKIIKNPELIITNTLEELAYTTTVRKDTVLSPTSSLGFAATKKVNVIEIQYKDASLMMSKLNDKIKEGIVISKKTGNDSLVNAFKTKLRSIQTQQGKYEFDGKQLTIYSGPPKENNLILTTDIKTHFIKIGEFYYKLQMTKTPISLNKVTEADIIDQLDKIVFDNDK